MIVIHSGFDLPVRRSTQPAALGHTSGAERYRAVSSAERGGQNLSESRSRSVAIIIFAIMTITYTAHELTFRIRAGSGGPRLRPRDFQLAGSRARSSSDRALLLDLRPSKVSFPKSSVNFTGKPSKL